ncbi:hypothetical protein BUALT_Bualt14G0032400 [Buddleja alternifolia]|uniref:Uncharacterized protein n=1 Tax=Buddleja alternifolia TaxID=168488 RepID=A0AAV6WHF2_9LAMI|nr:hypothetical protein BUALT_Bualt14G0032400 [Buddleja alternifolia]
MKENLKMMEEQKVRYLESLLQRKNENLEKYVSLIEPLEAEARKCYAEDISQIKSPEFKEMFVLDGCFIIELVRKFHMKFLREKDDPIFRMGWIMNSLQRDLMLFENQIPFFVLCKLFDSIEVPIKHNSSATGLREANVKFEKEEKDILFHIRFEKGTLHLAPLTIEDRTESFLRNLIAYEQYLQDGQCDHEVVANMFNKLTDSVTGPGERFIYAKEFNDVNDLYKTLIEINGFKPGQNRPVLNRHPVARAVRVVHENGLHETRCAP